MMQQTDTPSTSNSTDGNAWKLHSQLLADSIPIIELPICAVRLLDDARFPWILLIPRMAGLTQWLDMPEDIAHQVLDEVHEAQQVLTADIYPQSASISPRSATGWINCTFTASHASAMMRPGRMSSGGMAHADPTTLLID